MNHASFLFTPALIGLIAGIGHGIISHVAGLPLSLTDQFIAPLSASQFPD